MNRRYIAALTIGALLIVCGVSYACSIDGVLVMYAGTAVHHPWLIGAALAAAAAPAPAATDEDLKAACEALKTATDETKRFAEEANKQMKDQGALTSELKLSIDGALTKMTGLAAHVADIEQRLSSRSGSGGKPNAPQTAGNLYISGTTAQGEKVSELKSGMRGNFRVEIPHAALGMGTAFGGMHAAITSLPTSAGLLVEEMRIPGIVEIPRRRLTIRNLLSQGQTTSNSFRYVQELGFTNAAAVVSEGALKPESNLTFEDVDGKVTTIAHWMIASNQILDDAPGLRSIIDARLRYGLQLAEEAELLRGDGTGIHLKGLIPTASDYAQVADFPFAGAGTRIDIIRMAMLQVVLAEFQADGIVLNPIDWTMIELTKTDDGAYLMANPAGNLERRLWGLPVVDTQAMNQDEFLVGAFQMAAQIFDRQQAAVEVSTEDGDNFRRNRVTIRAEERLALAIYRPEALVTGDFGFVT